jgi:hypothetical protein
MNTPIYICSDIYVNENYVTNNEIGQYISKNDINSNIHSVRAALFNTKLWPKDTVLNVTFIGGEPWKHAWVEKVITEKFQPHSNIKFSFNPSGKKTIRISFDEKQGAYSAVGTDALNRSESEPTMNLGWLDPPGTKTSAGSFTFKGQTYTVPPGQPRNNNENGATVQHEFGHAIGMIHEHQNPRGKAIDWDIEKVYAKFSGPPNSWDKETINRNILKKYNESQINGSSFDPQSIMLYFFPGSLTKDGQGTSANPQLSQLDKMWLASAYANAPAPSQATAAPVQTTTAPIQITQQITPILQTTPIEQITPTVTLTPVYPPPPTQIYQTPIPTPIIIQTPPQQPPPPQYPPNPYSYPQQQPMMPMMCPPMMPMCPPPPCRGRSRSRRRHRTRSKKRCPSGSRRVCTRHGSKMRCKCVVGTSQCPPNRHRSPSYQNRCIPNTCPPGYRRNSIGECVRPPPPPRPQCSPGYIYWPNTKKCVRGDCPPGTKRNWKGQCYGNPVPIRCPRGQTLINGTCVAIYQPPPGKIHIHGPRCHHGRACGGGSRGHHGRGGGRGSIGRGGGKRGSIGRGGGRGSMGRHRSEGIIEYFQNTIASESPKLFNYKFLAIVIIVIIIAIFIYIMREQNL